MLSAVAKDGLSLRFASDNTKADKDIALAAAAQNGDSLQYVAANLRNDSEIILASLCDGFELDYHVRAKLNACKSDADSVIGLSYGQEEAQVEVSTPYGSAILLDVNLHGPARDVAKRLEVRIGLPAVLCRLRFDGYSMHQNDSETTLFQRGVRLGSVIDIEAVSLN